MLSKLLKYDLKNIFKFLSIFYILTMFFGLLTRIFLSFDNSFILHLIGKICNGVMIAGFFNILINTFMRSWVRFKNNFYGDEAYLTHTLPVEKKTLYLSKLVTSIISVLVGILVVILTIFIAYYSKENLEAVKSIFLPLKDLYEANVGFIITGFILVVFIEFINLMQTGFTGILIGYKMNNMKNLFSVIFGFVVHMISQVFVVLALLVYGLFNKEVMNLFISNETPGFDFIKSFLIFGGVVYLMIFVIEYFVNQKIFNKGVNVD